MRSVTVPPDEPIGLLWEVEWNGDRLWCAVYRDGAGLQLRIESPTAVIAREPFDMRPRAFARAHSFRDSLTRRGWRDSGRIAPGGHVPRQP